jgi:hypothetical protein
VQAVSWPGSRHLVMIYPFVPVNAAQPTITNVPVKARGVPDWQPASPGPGLAPAFQLDIRGSCDNPLSDADISVSGGSKHVLRLFDYGNSHGRPPGTLAEGCCGLRSSARAPHGIPCRIARDRHHQTLTAAGQTYFSALIRFRPEAGQVNIRRLDR